MFEKARFPVRILRFGGLAWHVLSGRHAAARSIPHLTPSQGNNCIRQWSAKLLRVLDVRVEISGTLEHDASRGLLMVSNHVSWLNIPAISMVGATRFVAKAEVRNWPIPGPLCANAGTIFIKRTRTRDITTVNRAIAAAIADRACCALFPEGTSSPLGEVKRFHPALLQSALNCKACVQPIAIRYVHSDGSPCVEAEYCGDTTLVESILRVTALSGITAQIQILRPIDGIGMHRSEMARVAATQIALALGARGDKRAVPAVQMRIRH